jgi:hypothetical protein
MTTPLDSKFHVTSSDTPVDTSQTEKKAESSSKKDFIEMALEGVKEHAPISQGTIPPVSTPVDQEKTEETLQFLPSQVRTSLLKIFIERIDWDKLTKLPPEDQAFIHFANSMMINGIICSARAARLELFQVSSLDKNPRPENEVEVNAYITPEGFRKSLFDPAKGAIPILLERKSDSPTIDYAPLTEDQERKLSEMGSLAAMFRPTLLKSGPLILLEESVWIPELSKRAHAGMLILIDPENLELKDNEGQRLEDVKGLSNDSWVKNSLEEVLRQESNQHLVEVKMNANIAPTSFSLIIVPRHYEQYKEFFALQEHIKFVDSVESDITYNFPPPEHMSNRTNTSVMVRISHPNFEPEAHSYFQKMKQTAQRPYVIHHVCKGPVPSDGMYKDYWSKVGPEQYEFWLSQ